MPDRYFSMKDAKRTHVLYVVVKDDGVSRAWFKAEGAEGPAPAYTLGWLQGMVEKGVWVESSTRPSTMPPLYQAKKKNSS